MDLILEDLQCKGLKIYQSKNGYRFTSDSVALANFVSVKNNGVLIDFCSGSGVVGILANAKNRIKKVYLVELQKRLSDMCAKTVEFNEIKNIEIINTNVLGVHKLFKNINVDTITCNPPYFSNKQIKKENTEIAIAKHEIEITLEDIIKEASLILKDNGRFYISHKSSRLCDVFYLLRQYKLEPKELLILPESKNDKVVLIKAIKGGEVGLKIL